MRARLAEAPTGMADLEAPGSSCVAAIGVAVEEPLEAPARDDDAPAEAQGRKLPAGDEFVCMRSRDPEGHGRLGHGKDQPVVTLHSFTSENGPGRGRP